MSWALPKLIISLIQLQRDTQIYETVCLKTKATISSLSFDWLLCNGSCGHRGGLARPQKHVYKRYRKYTGNSVTKYIQFIAIAQISVIHVFYWQLNSINQYWPNMITYYCYNGWNDDYKISLVVWNEFNLFLICCTIFCNIWQYNPYFQKQYFLNTTLLYIPLFLNILGQNQYSLSSWSSLSCLLLWQYF